MTQLQPPPIGNWTPADYQAVWWLVWKLTVLPLLGLFGGILVMLILLWRKP